MERSVGNNGKVFDEEEAEQLDLVEMDADADGE